MVWRLVLQTGRVRSGLYELPIERPARTPVLNCRARRDLSAACSPSGPFRTRRCLTEIFRLQFDRRTVRRAVGGVVPGVAVAVQGFGAGDALGGDQSFQGRQPVPVIGLPGV